MQNRIVEISSDGAYLNISRGFLVVSIEKEKVGQVAIEDMAALVIRGHGSSLSVNTCSRLAEANVPVVICGSNQSPDSIIWPISGHFAQGLHMQAQAIANKPMLKRLWAQLIREKIQAQATVLKAFLLNADDLDAMSKRVKSGDSDNLEAQAARRYWQRLMGEDFRRDRASEGPNAALNYGYTVLRAAVSRSILAAGLHPSLSIQHQSRGDALRLADDLMEPFRPWVDFKVRKMMKSENVDLTSLSPDVKAELVEILQMDFLTPFGASPMQTCLDRMAQSLVRVFMNESQEMDIPNSTRPLVEAS